ncbi:MAG TPA: hypothetical protein VJ276_12070 [Thermoanaerobaculia bacterium]|nr:hypothetical protein [Thermoanaerobaculia bacterium]
MLLALPVFADRVSDWQDDIRFFGTELPKRHKNFFTVGTRAEFDAAVARLEADVPELADHQIKVRLMELAAFGHDAHTGLSLVGLTPLPIEMVWLRDGLYITRVASGHAEAAGGRVVAIGGRPIAEALDAVRRIIPYENEWWLRYRAPLYLMFTELLAGSGITDRLDGARFEVERPDGTHLDFDLPSGSLRAGDPSWPDPPPLFRQQTTVNYWRTTIGSDTVYFAYNICNDMPSQSLAAFAKEMWAAVDRDRPARLIIDLRNNLGGSSSLFAPIVTGLQSRPWLNQRGRVFAFIGRATFSSGMFAAIDLRKGTNAILIGEPTGGSPNSFGEIVSFILPHSRLQVLYSTKSFSLLPNGELTVEPDVRVEPSAADWAAGRDPVLLAAFPPRRRAM